MSFDTADVQTIEALQKALIKERANLAAVIAGQVQSQEARAAWLKEFDGYKTRLEELERENSLLQEQARIADSSYNALLQAAGGYQMILAKDALLVGATILIEKMRDSSIEVIGADTFIKVQTWLDEARKLPAPGWTTPKP